MSKLYHGKPPNHPSQIKHLADAHLNYRDFNDEVDRIATHKKDDIWTVAKFKLKSLLTQDLIRFYYSGVDIRAVDLEKCYHTGGQLITGRNLFYLAQWGGENL